jgi:PAS domain S-box-containing protein
MHNNIPSVDSGTGGNQGAGAVTHDPSAATAARTLLSTRARHLLRWLTLALAIAVTAFVAFFAYQRADAWGAVTLGLGLALIGCVYALSNDGMRRRLWARKEHQSEITQLRYLFESSLDLILVTDRRGTFTRVSPSATLILGYRPEEMIGRNGVGFVHPGDLDSTREEMRMARRGHDVRNFETRYMRKDGGIVTLNWMGVWSDEIDRHFFIGRDMTAQKKLEAAERNAKEALTAIINTSPVAIICLNLDRTVLLWSRAAEEIFGYTGEEVVGQPYPLVPPGGDEEFYDLIDRAIAGEVLRDIRVKRLRKDGTPVEVSFEGAAIMDNGRVKALAYALTDITERNKMEQQLRQSQKLDAIGQLTGGIAHDFNNMLSVITGTIDILAAGVADRPDLASIARLIGEAAERGASLTGHLLAFARKQPLQPQITEIRQVLMEAIALLRPTLGEQIEIDWRLREDAWPAMVDPAQLVTAILNLAVNARDVMPEGGKLTIETSNVRFDDGDVGAGVDVTAGSYVMIAVSDTGPGIPEAIKEKIFEPFFTTKGVGKGTGLGLSMVYGFVKQSGGHIKLYSEDGQGATFKIYLPRADAASATGEVQAEAAPGGGSECILVVEDDPTVLSSVLVQLANLGYATITAGNAQEALDLIDSGARFDLLFTDMVMPGPLNGRRLAEEARRRRPDIKVLFTSGYTEDASIRHGRIEPGVLLLVKPYRKNDLARMIRTALAKDGAEQPQYAERRIATPRL